MIIKKYVVNDMKEALVRAKYELGKEAIIVSQKTVRPGKWYQIFRKKMLEVTVACEDKVHDQVKKEKEDLSKILFTHEKPKIGKTKERETSDALLLEAQRALKDSQGKKAIQKPFVAEKPQEDSPKQDLLKEVFGHQEASRKKWEVYAEKNLLKEKLDEHTLKDFVKQVYGDNAFLREKKLGRINVLIGPTGVGKTTTIAKIASKALLEEDLSVGLITIDTYRIAAVEQLKKYAEILNIPCETIGEPGELKEKLEKLKDCDVILVDTIGASPKDTDRIEDIKSYLDELPLERNTYLAMSMSQDVDTNNRILKKYQELQYHGIILTKFDEVENLNNFWNLLEKNLVPAQYYCHGQAVPEDITEASLDNVLGFLWKELYYD